MKLPNWKFEKFERILFGILLLVSLFPIWTNLYFLTGDGPCHIYNSKVLLDFITNQNVDFYSSYYELNGNTEPNWFSHVVLAALLAVFPDFMAEKILLTSYVLLFGFLIRGVIFQIDPKNVFLSLLALPFMFHTTFQMGFFNYSFGFVFCFLSIWFWLSSREKWNIGRVIVFMLINLLLYFTHPVGFLLAGLLIGCIPLSDFLSQKQNENGRLFRVTLLKYSLILVGFLPGILMMFEYLSRKGLNPTPSEADPAILFQNFKSLSSLVLLTDTEDKWAAAIAILFAIILVYALFVKFKIRKISPFDGLLAAFILITFIYFYQPGTLAGAGILHVRFQFIPYLIVLVWFASIKFHLTLRWAISIATFTIVTELFVIRAPKYAVASDVLKEYLSVREHIEDRSTVLPLSFSHNGKTANGEEVANRIWLYMHAFDYVGSDRSLVLFGNYEANTGYFPIIWKEGRNPYLHLSMGDGLEALPPGVGILNYEASTGSSVDYVIIWCLDEQYLEHQNTVHLFEELNGNYELTFTSENALAKVYRKLR